MPLFTRAEMDLHISKSGKNFDKNKQNHAVPTSMKKAKTFLDDEYLKDLTCASDDCSVLFCITSMRTGLLLRAGLEK